MLCSNLKTQHFATDCQHSKNKYSTSYENENWNSPIKDGLVYKSSRSLNPFLFSVRHYFLSSLLFVFKPDLHIQTSSACAQCSSSTASNDYRNPVAVASVSSVSNKVKFVLVILPPWPLCLFQKTVATVAHWVFSVTEVEHIWIQYFLSCSFLIQIC